MTRRSAYHLAAAVFLLLLSLQPARASTWIPSVVDNTATNTGKNLSIAVDPAGKLYLGYLDTTTTPYLKYANNADGAWVLESMKNVLPNTSDVSTATVFTPGGPRIMAYSYSSATGRTMYQAARKITGDGWQLQDIGGGINPMTGEPEPPMTTIVAGTQTGAVQYMGFTFITFNNGNGLKYANERDMAWYDISQTGIQSDLVIDTSGNVHVVYADSNGTLMYAKNPTGLGQSVVLQDAANNIVNPAVAIDGNNVIHVIYTHGSGANYNVYHTSKPATGGSWSIPVNIGACGRTGGYTTLKVDGVNQLHAAWYNSATKRLLYTTRTAIGSWSAPETVAYTGASSDYGQYAALAIDRFNNVNIAFYDAASSAVTVVKKQNPAIDASPSPLLYGSVAQGGAAAQTVTVSNKGNANLTISSVPTITGASASEFLVTQNSSCSAGLVLAPGGSCSTEVRFSPTTPGAKVASLNIASNDPNVPAAQVLLKGTTDASVSYTIYTAVYNNSMVPGIGGSISPSGAVSAASGLNKSFTITPSPGYLIAGVYLDGTSPQDFGTAIGAVTSYTFSEVSSDHNITAVFYPVVPVNSWSVATVDNSGTDTGKYCSMATNPATGKLTVGYLDNSAGTPLLKMSSNASGSWSAPEAVPIPNVTNAGTATVYTPAGPRVMAYTYDPGTLKRKYVSARKWLDLNPLEYSGYPFFVSADANLWQLQDIAGGLDPMGNRQPAIDNTTTDTFTGAVQYCSGSPCSMNNSSTFISYADGYNLWYANERDMYYHEFEPLAPQAGSGKQSDLALDSLGNIHIVYYNPTNGSHGRLMYAENPTSLESGFQSSILTDSTVSSPSIAVDNNDLLHVVYVDSAKHLQYINKQAAGGGSWSAPYDLGPVGSAGAFTSIKANGLDIVHVAYYSNNGGGTGQVMYAQRSASGVWTTPAAVPDAGSSNYGQYTALVVDDNHNVNIAYYDVTNTALKVATKLLPVITATPDPVNYGTVSTGSITERTVTVSNPGQANLSVGTATITGFDAGPFSITSNGCAGVSLAPSASCSITVAFAPSTTGFNSATLHVPSNDPYTADKQVLLQGTAISGYTIHASAGPGGSISPSGDVTVEAGACQSFTMTPSAGFFFGDARVDGTWQSAASPSYIFCPVEGDHTIYAWFESPFRIMGTLDYFGTLQSAYSAAMTGSTIQCQAVDTLEELLLDLNLDVTLDGGYDAEFLSETGATQLKSLTVSNGNAILEGLVLQ